MASDKQINIGVGADISGLKTGMDSAAKTVQDAGKKMESAAKEATAKTESSFANLRQAYRATAKDAYEIALQQGTNSAAFLEAAKRAGEFKDELDLVNTKIAAFSSDTPVLTSALGVGQGLAGAFATAQGAMALFGGQSKEVEQALLKVQGAMALLQGLQSIGQLTDAMSAFSAVIKVQVLPALMTMQGAIIATGIGAVVVAVVALTQAASAYNDQVDREIDLKKERAIQDKLWNEGLNKAINANLKTEELKIRAMKDGTAKQLAEFDLRKRMEIQAEKETYEASNKTYFDSSRLAERIKYIEEFYRLQGETAVREASKAEQKAASKLPKVKLPKEVQQKGESVLNRKLKPIMYETNLETNLGVWGTAFQEANNQMTAFEERMIGFSDNVNQTITNGVVNAFSGMAQAIGESLANGANVMDNVGAVLLGAVGSMAIQLGQLAIGVGISMDAIKKAFTNPYTAIAAGVALVALGSYVSSKAKAITSGKSSGGGGGYSGGGNFSSNNGFSGFTPTDNTFSINSRLIGTDLLLSVQKSSKKMDRIR